MIILIKEKKTFFYYNFLLNSKKAILIGLISLKTSTVQLAIFHQLRYCNLSFLLIILINSAAIASG